MEVYNGITYRVDADFRGVMFDYMQGAWALRRAGYATDPQYPIKLMKLIDTYNLDELDKVGI